jgi:hypothetical protein
VLSASITILPVAVLAVFALPAQAAVTVSRFKMTPSTTQAGGHPTLDVAVAFEPPTADVQSIVLHLPAGLSVNAQAAPFCRRTLLVSDLCPLTTKIGSVAIAGEALGFQAEARRNLYNERPSGSERLRLGIPIFGTSSRGGVALSVPVVPRPADGGLDLTVAGPPREVGGYAIRIRQVSFRLQGVIRRNLKGRIRRRGLVRNPRSCVPATTVLEIITREAQTAPVSHVSAFTPTGC